MRWVPLPPILNYEIPVKRPAINTVKYQKSGVCTEHSPGLINANWQKMHFFGFWVRGYLVLYREAIGLDCKHLIAGHQFILAPSKYQTTDQK